MADANRDMDDSNIIRINANSPATTVWGPVTIVRTTLADGRNIYDVTHNDSVPTTGSTSNTSENNPDTSITMYTFTYENPAFVCANIIAAGAGQNCSDRATKVCTNCRLVYYCSVECRNAHWSEHKAHCKSELAEPSWKPGWMTENRSPNIIGYTTLDARYLFGSMPAIDVCKLDETNSEWKEPLKLLFAASGDLRNVIMTVLELPEHYSNQPCHLFINDKNFDVVARNLIILLAAFVTKDHELIIHMWYSDMLTEIMIKRLHDDIYPLIQSQSRGHEEDPEMFSTLILAHDTSDLRITFTRKEWATVLEFLDYERAFEVEWARSERQRTISQTWAVDSFDNRYLSLPLHMRVAWKRYREEGILLPFGRSRNDFVVPNPLFWQCHEGWATVYDSDPLNGWRLPRSRPLHPTNDIYGGLYYELEEIISKFCYEIAHSKLIFELGNHDAFDLNLESDFVNRGSLRPPFEGNIRSPHLFDRIEVGNLADRDGPARVLETFSNLLKPKDQNEKATLITLHQGAVRASYVQEQDYTLEVHSKIENYQGPTGNSVVRKCWPSLAMRAGALLPAYIDIKALFARYMQKYNVEAKADEVGLKMKDDQTVIAAWPYMLPEEPTVGQVSVLAASNLTGNERYIEWVRK